MDLIELYDQNLWKKVKNENKWITKESLMESIISACANKRHMKRKYNEADDQGDYRLRPKGMQYSQFIIDHETSNLADQFMAKLLKTALMLNKNEQILLTAQGLEQFSYLGAKMKQQMSNLYQDKKDIDKINSSLGEMRCINTEANYSRLKDSKYEYAYVFVLDPFHVDLEKMSFIIDSLDHKYFKFFAISTSKVTPLNNFGTLLLNENKVQIIFSKDVMQDNGFS